MVCLGLESAVAEWWAQTKPRIKGMGYVLPWGQISAMLIIKIKNHIREIDLIFVNA